MSWSSEQPILPWRYAMTMPSIPLPETGLVTARPWTVALVQAGRLREMPYRDGTWTTAIYKEPIAEHVTVDRHGIVGDEHTGSGPDPERALCCHPARHYGFWSAYFRTPFPLGTFGENLTLDGLDDSDLCIGD